MEETKSQKNLIKVIILLAGLIFVGLLCVGIVQTIIHNNLLAKQQALATQNQTILEDTQTAKDEIDIRESDDYIDDFYEQENGYGNEGDIIITPPND